MPSKTKGRRANGLNSKNSKNSKNSRTKTLKRSLPRRNTENVFNYSPNNANRRTPQKKTKYSAFNINFLNLVILYVTVTTKEI